MERPKKKDPFSGQSIPCRFPGSSDASISGINEVGKSIMIRQNAPGPPEQSIIQIRAERDVREQKFEARFDLHFFSMLHGRRRRTRPSRGSGQCMPGAPAVSTLKARACSSWKYRLIW